MQKHPEKWGKIRAAGKREFILKYGGLFIGLLGMGLTGSLFRIVDGFITSNNSFSFFDRSFLFGIIRSLIAAFPAGCLWGWIMWKLNERNYAQRNEALK